MNIPQVNDELEKVLLKTRYSCIVGVDEVGRGSWAGPVVVGAYVYKTKTKLIPGVNDSKKLTLNKRERLGDQLIEDEHSIGLAQVSEIDEVNILEATRLAIKRAVKGLELDNALVLIDGHFRDPFEFEHRCVVKGDAKHYSIAAASIIAKVYRDNLMKDLSGKYPQYGFERHVGYGTKQHREALERYGVCEIHRRSYKPIAQMVKG
jgi:ribonuclease HII